MTVRIEKQGHVWTIVHSRFEVARNAMDPDLEEFISEERRREYLQR